MIKKIIGFILGNLEIIALCYCLQFILNVGTGWEYWVTVIVVSICSGISTNYNKINQK